MRLASEADQRRYREGGLSPMKEADACEALGRLLAEPRSNSMVASIEWDALKALLESRRQRPLLAELGSAKGQDSRTAATSAAQASTLPALLEAAVPSMREDVAVEFVQREVALVLGLGAPSTVPVTTGLFDLGMDSLMAVELKRRLERGSGRALPSTLTFNYPNVSALAGYLLRLLAPSATEPAPPSEVVPPGIAAAPAFDGSAELDELTDDELEARLRARLEQAR
jgi:acyl carrier protein